MSGKYSENFSVWHEWNNDESPFPDAIGPYEILDRVASPREGSQCFVYRGRDGQTGVSVAVKVLGDPLDSFESSVLAVLIGPAALEEMHREAKRLSSLNHPNIVRIVGTGEDMVQGAYIAMEWMSGGSLRSRLDQAGQGIGLPLLEALSTCHDLLAALGAAHGAGILHRDVKPENVLLNEQGRAKLSDFGIAADLGDVFGALAGRGTAGYMAPEHEDPERAAEVGPATDIYAVGVVLFEMLVGRRPRPDEDFSRSLTNLPPQVTRTVEKALTPDPKQRYRSAQEMAETLNAADDLA